MNYYEMIQMSIDLIEENIKKDVVVEDIIKPMYISRANFYRLFFALVGYSVKEYIRRRKLSEASKWFVDHSILETSVEFGFNSHETFSRAFKKVTGKTPTYYKKNKLILNFERMDIMNKYFEVQDQELLEKYPDIKVLKELEPFKVAYYCYFGKEPEDGAFKVISEYLKENHISTDKMRIFGFNNPSPMNGEEEYGYEVWVTIDKDVDINHDLIKTKMVDGGLYAVTSVKGGPDNIFPTWQRLGKWLQESKYRSGNHQWLEEHIGFDADYNHVGSIDIYMPIALADDQDAIRFVHQPDVHVAYYRGVGAKSNQAFDKVVQWANKQGLIDGKHRFFGYYDHTIRNKKDYWYEVCVTIATDMEVIDPDIKTKVFKGGYYAVQRVPYSVNGLKWYDLMKWVDSNSEYTYGSGYSFFEEYLLTEPSLTLDTVIIQHMPIKEVK